MAARLTWAEPPDHDDVPRRIPGQLSYGEEAAELRAHPGKSAILVKFPVERAQRARSLANDIRTARLKAFEPAGAFSASTVTETEHDANGQPVKVVNVYASYAGPPD